MRFFIILVCFLFSLVCKSQVTLEFISDVPCNADRITVDELGNVYTQTSTAIERWNAQGGKKYRNSELQWGAYNTIDVTDPLRPFIYFPGAGKIVFFDNTLSMQGSPIDLYEKGFDQIECVAGSRGDALWLWDARSLELVRVDHNFQTLSSTGNLSVLLGTTIAPLQIVERGSYVYLRTAQQVVFVFDRYGTYKTKMTLGVCTDMQVVNDRVMVYGEKELEILSVNDPNKISIPLPYPDAVYWSLRDVLYALHGGRLSKWKFPETARN